MNNQNKVLGKLAELYVAYMCVVFVVAFHNNYIDIMQAKRAYYLLGTGMTIAVMAIVLVYSRVHKMVGYVSLFKGKNLIVLVMMVGWMISIMTAPDRLGGILGDTGKCTGLLIYLAGGIAILLLGNYLTWSNVTSWAFIIGTVIVCSLQVLNRFGVDPLQMYSNIHPDYITRFISTIGQINYNASLDCIILSVLMALFLVCNERQSKIIYGITLVIAFAGAICCNSDSVYVGIAVVFYVLLIYTIPHPKKWRSLVGLLILIDVAAYIVWFIRGYIRYTELADTSQLLMDFNLRRYFTAMILIFGIVCLILNRISEWDSEWAYKMWIYMNIVIVCFTPLIVKQRLHLFVNPNYFKTQLMWSNARTNTWMICLELFQKSNIWHKLFGYGFNNVYAGLATIGQNLQEDEAIVDAHNIVLNSLVTSGLVGTVLWAILLVVLLTQAIRGLKKQPENLVVVTGLFAYLAQGMVNGPQILTTPVFLTAIGVYWATVDKEKHING